jgi:hypothetical protein
MSVFEQDSWPIILVRPVWLNTTPILQFREQGIAAKLCTDADYWLASILPAPLWGYPHSVPTFAQQGEIASLITDEDAWQNPAAPAQASLRFPQPWQFEQQEVFARFDEDYWQHFIAPTIPQPPIFISQDAEFVAAQICDEDYWQSSPPWSVTRPPILFRAEDDFVFVAALDESGWNFSPVWSAAPAPIIFRSDDDAAFAQPHSFDEDFWNVYIVNVPASLLWPQPWICETLDSELFPLPTSLVLGSGGASPDTGAGSASGITGVGVVSATTGAGSAGASVGIGGVEIISGEGIVNPREK